MKLYIASRTALTALLAAGAFLSASALAGPHDRDDHRPSPPPPAPAHAQPAPAPAPHAQPAPSPQQAFRFDDRYHGVALNYYKSNYAKGKCPTGLSRRGGNCAPPKSYKREWVRGKVLPRNVRYYDDVPRPLLAELPPPPHGHRYVRVGADILLIDATRAVIDALQDVFY